MDRLCSQTIITRNILLPLHLSNSRRLARGFGGVRNKLLRANFCLHLSCRGIGESGRCP